MDRNELVQILDDKLQGLELRLAQKLEEKLEQKLEEKLQPLWQAVTSLDGRVGALEEKLEAVAEDVRQIKYDTCKLRGRLNRVDLEDLRNDVDAIKATLGLQ